MKKLPSISEIVPEQRWTATGMESLVKISGVVTRPHLSGLSIRQRELPDGFPHPARLGEALRA